MNKKKPLPIEKLSFSAMMSYLANPTVFWRNYVLKQWDNIVTPPILEGKGLHLMLENYYSNKPAEEGFDEWFSKESAKVTYWGKTGSQEKSRENIYRAKDNAFNAIGAGMIPKREEINILNIESPIMHNSGHGIPLKATPDLIYSFKTDTAEEPDLYARDWKKVSALSETEDESGLHTITPAKYILQAYFLASVAEKEYGYPLRQIIFTEIRSVQKNKESNSVRNISVTIGENWRDKAEFRAVSNMVDDFLLDLSTREVMLPNISDMMNGQEEWELLLQRHKLTNI